MYAYPFLSPVQTFGLLNAHFLVRLYFTINTNEKTTEKCLTGFFCCAIVKNAILWQDMPTMLSKQGWLML